MHVKVADIKKNYVNCLDVQQLSWCLDLVSQLSCSWLLLLLRVVDVCSVLSCAVVCSSGWFSGLVVIFMPCVLVLMLVIWLSFAVLLRVEA